MNDHGPLERIGDYNIMECWRENRMPEHAWPRHWHIYALDGEGIALCPDHSTAYVVAMGLTLADHIDPLDVVMIVNLCERGEGKMRHE